MALRVDANVTPGYATDDRARMAARAMRDGSLSFADFLQAMAIEGRVYRAGAGIETTPIQSVTYDQDKPEFTVSVPDGTAILVLEVEINWEAYAGTDNECIISYVEAAVGAGTSTAADFGPLSTKSSNTSAGNCTVVQLHTVNISVTGYTELGRLESPHADAAPSRQVWAPRPAPVIVGDGSLVVQVSGTSTQPTFFLAVTWLEVPENFLS